MEVFGVVLGFVVGAIVGIMGYRYMLKRDPATLEKWAAAAKAAGKEL